MGVVTGIFQYTNGSPVANAAYQWKLSSDAIEFSATSACVVPTIVNGYLDANGNMTSTFAFNDVLSTTAGVSTYYQLTVKALQGGQVWNESYYLTGTAANLNLIPPAGIPIIVTTPTTAITLQTNGVSNDIQSLENLVAGTNVSLNYAAGATTINATAGSSGFTFSTPGQGGFVGPGMTMDWFGKPGTIKKWPVADQIQVFQFNLQSNYVISRITAPTANVTNVAGALCGFSIWNATNTTKLLDSGPIVSSASATAAGFANFICNTVSAVTLTGGTYSLAITANNTVSQFIGLAQNDGGSPSSGVGVFNRNATRYGYAASTSSGAVFPSALGTITPFQYDTGIAGVTVTAVCLMAFFEP